MNDDTPVCVGVHHRNPERPRAAVPGARLCRGCLSNLERAVADLPRMHAALVARLAPSGGGQPKVSGTPERALPIDPAVVELRGDIVTALAAWAVFVSERFDVGVPRSTSPEATGALLSAQRSRLVSEPWAGEFLAAAWLLWRRARAVLNPTGRRRRELMACPEADCPGVIYAYLSPTDSLLPAVIECDTTEMHTWPADRWLTLGRKIHRADRVVT